MMLRILTSLLVLSIFSSTDAKVPHLFVYFSDSHRVFYENWFTPTMRDDVDLHVFEVDQICPTGEFYTTGWKEITQQKLEITLGMIDRYWGEIVIYSDVDVQFFRPFVSEILDLLQNHDFLIQKGNPKKWSCAGFFALRANHETKALIENALEFMTQGRSSCDEKALNLALRRNRSLRWTQLPIAFYSGGVMTDKLWMPGDSLHIPEKIILHHSNYSIGIQNKLRQLEYINELIEGRT